MWVQDLWPEVLKDTGVIKNKILLKILDKIINKIYVCFDLIFVQSESFKNYINKKKISNCKILHNPGYNFFFKIKKKVSKKINILYAGNIGKAQPVEFICKLVNNLPKNYFFNIAGSGKDYSKLYNKLNFKNKNFELLGNLSFKKLRYFYNQSDLYESETLCRELLEAYQYKYILKNAYPDESDNDALHWLSFHLTKNLQPLGYIYSCHTHKQ